MQGCRAGTPPQPRILSSNRVTFTIILAMPGVSLRVAPTLDVPALEERDGLVPMLLGQRLQHAPIDLLGARPFLLELRRSDVVRDKGGDRTAQHLPIAGGPRAPWRQRGGDIRS